MSKATHKKLSHWKYGEPVTKGLYGTCKIERIQAELKEKEAKNEKLKSELAELIDLLRRIALSIVSKP